MRMTPCLVCVFLGRVVFLVGVVVRGSYVNNIFVASLV